MNRNKSYIRKKITYKIYLYKDKGFDYHLDFLSIMLFPIKLIEELKRFNYDFDIKYVNVSDHYRLGLRFNVYKDVKGEDYYITFDVKLNTIQGFVRIDIERDRNVCSDYAISELECFRRTFRELFNILKSICEDLGFEIDVSSEVVFIKE